MSNELPHTLEGFSVFVDGDKYAGISKSVTLPKLKQKTKDYKSGGMSVAVKLPSGGLEPLDVSLVFNDFPKKLLRAFGFRRKGPLDITVRGYMEIHDSERELVISMSGHIYDMDLGDVDADESIVELKMVANLLYYKFEMDGEVIHEIDAINCVTIIDGEDRSASKRRALAL